MGSSRITDISSHLPHCWVIGGWLPTFSSGPRFGVGASEIVPIVPPSPQKPTPLACSLLLRLGMAKVLQSSPCSGAGGPSLGYCPLLICTASDCEEW